MTLSDKLPESLAPAIPSDSSSLLAREAWRVFGIMAEFVEATERLQFIRPAVSIFGSARTPQDHAYYKLTEDIARQQLEEIGEQASARFSQQWSREIKRLKHLQTINPNVRPEEIERLEQLKAQGEQALGNLSLVPDSIRVLVAVKP